MEKEEQKKYFPVFLDLSEKKVVVIGGGTIATRRVNTLLEFAGRIMVISPELTKELQELQKQGRIEWSRESYVGNQIEDADMVIAATNQSVVNHRIKADCQNLEKETGRQILVSVIDDRELCDFYFPSIVMKDDIVIGINSSGTDPKITKTVRKQIEEKINADTIYKE